MQTRWIRAAMAMTLAAAALAGCDDALASQPVAAAEPQAIARPAPRFGRARPLVAVVGETAGTELADFVVPYGILSQSQVADVMALGTRPGPMRMRPALKIQPEATLAEFDARFPDGADYVIVPAVSEDGVQDATLVDWLQAQAAKGATVVSICDGALVVAKAGLLKGRTATGHWATQQRREHDYPDTRWVKNVRFVADGNVVSSAGVTAAIPLSLALVEAIGGTRRAAEVASRIGMADWRAAHDSERFGVGAGMVFTAVTNRYLSSHDDIELPLEAGVDEVALALAADAFGRTYRSRVFAVAASGDAIRTRSGLEVLPDRRPSDVALRPAFAQTPVGTLDSALATIAASYGARTAALVATQLEYPMPAPAR